MIQQWPPAYSIRRSVRARKIFLQIKPLIGLEIIIPAHRKRFDVQNILETHRNWIEKTTLNLPFQAPSDIALPPTHLECRAIEKIWTVHYHDKPQRKCLRLKALDVEKQLIIYGPMDTLEVQNKYRSLLKKWLINYAAEHLIPWITELSKDIHLNFKAVKIRAQSTLWGSCNSKKIINLNYKLVFLPIHLVRHVLLHELCHLQYLNHSECFWDLLAKWDPQSLLHKQLLKTADQYVPDFLRT